MISMLSLCMLLWGAVCLVSYFSQRLIVCTCSANLLQLYYTLEPSLLINNAPTTTAPLTLPLIQEKKSKTPTSFSRYYREQRSGHEQVLTLSKVLNDDVNVGYHGWKNLVLKSYMLKGTC